MAQDNVYTIDMPELNRESGKTARLRIRCGGERGVIACTASINHHDNENTGWFSHMVFQDYNVRLEIIKARATQKAIDSLFDKWTTPIAIERIQQDARNHYVETA